MPAICRFGVSLLLATLLAGCSSTSFLYNRLDTFIAWELDDYVDLTPTQADEMDRVIDDFMWWHRTQELPRYVALLDRVDRDLTQPVNADVLMDVEHSVESALNRLRDRMLTDMLAFGATLSPEQRLQFVETLQAQHTELSEERLARSEQRYREDLEDQLVDSLSDYLGRLTPVQREQVTQVVPAFHRLDGMWMEDRRVWLDRLHAIIDANEPNWPDLTREHALNFQATRSQGYREGFANNMQRLRELLVVVLNDRTDRQDAKLRKKLARYRDSFAELAADGVVPVAAITTTRLVE